MMQALHLPTCTLIHCGLATINTSKCVAFHQLGCILFEDKCRRHDFSTGRRREDDQECWVAISTPEFAEKTLAKAGRDVDTLTSALQEEFITLLGLMACSGQAVPELVTASAQRWGSAFKTDLCPARSLFDEGSRLAACGDFCVESSAEGALLSALDAAKRIKEFLKK